MDGATVTSLTFQAFSGIEYYVIADSEAGVVGSFAVNVICSG